MEYIIIIVILIASISSIASESDEGFGFVGIIGTCIYIYMTKIKPNLGAIGDFFSTVLTWILWGLILLAAFAAIRFVLGKINEASANQRELEKNQRLELQRQQKAKAKAKAREEERRLERIRKEKERIKEEQERHRIEEEQQEERNKKFQQLKQYLESIQTKNSQLEDDIRFLKPVITKLSIHDEDFLEQQPKILEFINESMYENRA